MSNSKLVSFTRLSPNYSKRTKKITKITPHHVAGRLSLKTLGNIFSNRSRQASSNYGIDNEGNIGMYVEEHNRAWTSSSSINDQSAITIEVANESIGGQWKISDKALASLILLSEDICRRNGIKQLNYNGKPSGSLTRHNMFANTNCPGPYLQSKFPYIETQVNNKLRGTNKPSTSVKKSLVVDGYWGKATTSELQKNLGTIVDGIISGQYPNHITKAIPSVSFNTRTGSNVIRKLQRKIGVNADGYIGPKTIIHLQKYLGTYQDGKISKPSVMVKELQRKLNKGVAF